MSLRIPDTPRAAFGEVAFPPITAIAHLLLQYFRLRWQRGNWKLFPQTGFAHKALIRGTRITPFRCPRVPFKDAAISAQTTIEGAPRFTLLPSPAQLILNYFLVCIAGE